MKGCDKMAASKKYASRDCGVFELTNLATSKKALRVDYANTVTLNITADSVKAKKRGRDAVTFANPMEGTLESEIQVYPFELFSIFGNGTITEGGDRAEMKTITATEAGKLTLPDDPKAGALFVYEKGDVGGTQIKGSAAAKVFTATTDSDIVVGKKYDVSYIVNDSTLQLVKINDNQELADFRVDAEINQKSEQGVVTPLHITCYKATPQRNIELAFAAEGDPITLKITFDLMTDADDEFVDIYQIKSLA